MKIKFKLLLVTTILCITSSLAFSQKYLNKNFIGYWTTDASRTRIIFFKDKDDVLQMVMWDSGDGEEIEVIKTQVVGNSIKATLRTPSTEWISYCTYTIVDKNNLKCAIGGDNNNTIIYLKRLK